MTARRALVVFVAVVAGFAGCGGTRFDSRNVPASTTPSTGPGATSAPPGIVVAGAMAGKRYCEVLLVTPTRSGARAEVYNSYPLNDCPPVRWRALSPKAIARQYRVPLAVLNGPRYWLMDSIEKTASPAPVRANFGGIGMIREASVDVGPLATANVPYKEHHVNRGTVFVYDRGATVYELLAPGGKRYVMQSWSQQRDPKMAGALLPALAHRLHLPHGWSYRTLALREPLRVVTATTAATVIQDDLGNTYSLEP